VQQAAAEALLNYNIGPLARQAFYEVLSIHQVASTTWMKDGYAPAPVWQTAAAHHAPSGWLRSICRQPARREPSA